MGRYQETAGISRQRYIQQIPGIQPEDRPPVRGQVADLSQFGGDPVRRLEARREDEMMHLPRAVITAVNGGYLDR